MEPARRVPGASSAIWNISIRGASCADRSDPGTERERLETMRELLAMLIFQWHLERQVIKFRLEQQLRLVLAVVGRHVRGLRQAQTPTELEFCQVRSSGEQERLGRRESHAGAARGSLSAKACPASTSPMQMDRRPVDRRWLEASDSEEELHFDSEPGDVLSRPAGTVHQAGSVHQAQRQHFPVQPSTVDTADEPKDARKLGSRNRWDHGGPKWPPSRSAELLGGQEPPLHDTKSDLYAPAVRPVLPTASGEEAPGGFPEQLRQIQQQLHQQQVQLEEQLQLQRQLQHRWPSPFTNATGPAGKSSNSPAPKRLGSLPGSKTQPQIAKPEASGVFPATVEGQSTQSSGRAGMPPSDCRKAEQAAPKWRRLYRVTTRGLGIRAGPDVNCPRTGAVLKRGAVFEASVVAPGADGRIYLKLSGWRGWAFDDSAVDPMDPSVEALTEQEVLEILTSSQTTSTGAQSWSHLGPQMEPSTLDPLVLPRRTEAERKPRGDGWSTPSGTPEADGWFLPPHRSSASPDEVLHPSISHEFREAMGLRPGGPGPHLTRQL
eukprot:s689_g42.t2